jgi:hypothetical protein
MTAWWRDHTHTLSERLHFTIVLMHKEAAHRPDDRFVGQVECVLRAAAIAQLLPNRWAPATV